MHDTNPFSGIEKSNIPIWGMLMTRAALNFVWSKIQLTLPCLNLTILSHIHVGSHARLRYLELTVLAL